MKWLQSAAHTTFDPYIHSSVTLWAFVYVSFKNLYLFKCKSIPFSFCITWSSSFYTPLDNLHNNHLDCFPISGYRLVKIHLAIYCFCPPFPSHELCFVPSEKSIWYTIFLFTNSCLLESLRNMPSWHSLRILGRRRGNVVNITSVSTFLLELFLYQLDV